MKLACALVGGSVLRTAAYVSTLLCAVTGPLMMVGVEGDSAVRRRRLSHSTSPV